MKLRRVFYSSSPTSTGKPHLQLNATTSHVKWINRLLFLIGVATLTADVLFFFLTNERKHQQQKQQLLLQKRRRRHHRQQQPKNKLEEQDQKKLEQSRKTRQNHGLRRQNDNRLVPGRRQQEQAEQQRQNRLPKNADNRFIHDKYRSTHAEVLAVFEEAGITLTEDEMREMPTWSEVVQEFGPHPILVGLPDHCQVFRQAVPAVERMIGSAGMFNTGTNLVTQLLKENCKIPERVQKYGINATREAHGIRWQVPWGKHTPAHYRKLHATKQASAAGIDKDAILPVITVRDPYEWMKSMCRNPYTVKWPHYTDQCPYLTVDNDGRSFNGVHVKYSTDRWQDALSLAHLWNDWYREYFNVSPRRQQSEEQRKTDEELGDSDESASSSSPNKHSDDKEYYPWIMVRMEDLIFHAKETITQVCLCIGGEMRSDRPFTYIVDSAKCDSPGHDCSTGLAQAWMKYGGRRKRASPLDEPGWTRTDYRVAKQVLDSELMEVLQYRHPEIPPF